MKVAILGAGCGRCRTLRARIRSALDRLGRDTPIETVDDPWRIAEFGIMYLPALVVDDRVILSGSVPDVDTLCRLLEETTP